MTAMRRVVPALAAALALLARLTLAQDAGRLDPETATQTFKKPAYSPYAGRNFPTRVFFGDTHLHTGLSLDASAGGAKIGPDAAYRFARGEEITTSTGQPGSRGPSTSSW